MAFIRCRLKLRWTSTKTHTTSGPSNAYRGESARCRTLPFFLSLVRKSFLFNFLFFVLLVIFFFLQPRWVCNSFYEEETDVLLSTWLCHMSGETWVHWSCGRETGDVPSVWPHVLQNVYHSNPDWKWTMPQVPQEARHSWHYSPVRLDVICHYLQQIVNVIILTVLYFSHDFVLNSLFTLLLFIACLQITHCSTYSELSC